MVDWRRRWLVRAIKLTLALILFGAGEASGLFHLLIPSGIFAEPWFHFLAMYILAAILADVVTRRISQKFFRAYHLGWQLSSQGAYQEAIRSYREQITYLAQHSWIEQLRTPLLLDEYEEGFAERIWVQIADAYFWLGDATQMVSSYEKCLEINPSSFTALYGLSIIAARTGGPPRPFKIRAQPLQFSSGCAMLALWLGAWGAATILMNVIFLAGNGDMVVGTIWDVAFSGLLLLIFFNVPVIVLGWLINQVVQAGYHSAYRKVAAGEFEAAERALEQDARYWRSNPGLDKMRRWFLDSTPPSYLERTLRLLAAVSLRLGKPEVFIMAYREILAINPESEVRYWLNLFEGNQTGAAAQSDQSVVKASS